MSEYEDFGHMHVKGRMNGWVEGIIVGEVDAVVSGRVHAMVVSDTLEVEMLEQDPNAIEKAKQTYAEEIKIKSDEADDKREEGGTADEA